MRNGGNEIWHFKWQTFGKSDNKSFHACEKEPGGNHRWVLIKFCLKTSEKDSVQSSLTEEASYIKKQSQ